MERKRKKRGLGGGRRRSNRVCQRVAASYCMLSMLSQIFPEYEEEAREERDEKREREGKKRRKESTSMQNDGALFCAVGLKYFFTGK